MPVLLETLQWWCDEAERSGPQNMAVDEWLLENAQQPVLRVYRWQPGWGSIGYFGSLAQATTDFPSLEWVRRWTGGGTVDHRADWTYTLVIPGTEALAQTRGAESYRLIHAAVAAVLLEEGQPIALSAGDLETGAASCFENPVAHDLVDGIGRKIAGAGQRRSRQGLLHQGSVSGEVNDALCEQRTCKLAKELGRMVQPFSTFPSEAEIEGRTLRYADPKWTTRR